MRSQADEGVKEDGPKGWGLPLGERSPWRLSQKEKLGGARGGEWAHAPRLGSAPSSAT